MFVSSNRLDALLPYFKRKLNRVYDDREIESIFFFTCFHHLGLSRSAVLNEDKRLTESELLEFREFVARLMTNEPIQYILGKAEFYGLPMIVNSSVLIPRPETEELADLIIKDTKGKTGLRILDIGTGSGCIPIAIKKNLPASTVFAVDVSADAIAVATKNAFVNDTEIEFLQLDFLQAAETVPGELNILVSNPPYIPASDQPTMHKNVVEHEPSLALFVADHDPLIFYKKIAAIAFEKLVQGGKLYVEIHHRYGKEVAELFTAAGLKEVHVLKDLPGADRFVTAVK